MKCDYATQHILQTNFKTGGVLAHQGIVLHIMQGSLAGTLSWFNNPHAQASSHFGCGKDGTLYQFVDTDNMAWTEVSGNPYWISVECEGFVPDSLTPQQIATIAKLYEWAEGLYHFGFAITSSITGKGLGHHAMGGAAWGGNLDCPGNNIIAQKPAIVAAAEAIRNTHK